MRGKQTEAVGPKTTVAQSQEETAGSLTSPGRFLLLSTGHCGAPKSPPVAAHFGRVNGGVPRPSVLVNTRISQTELRRPAGSRLLVGMFCRRFLVATTKEQAAVDQDDAGGPRSIGDGPAHGLNGGVKKPPETLGSVTNRTGGPARSAELATEGGPGETWRGRASPDQSRVSPGRSHHGHQSYERTSSRSAVYPVVHGRP
jgi:hypothetical protein